MPRANNPNADRERPVHRRRAPKCTDDEREFVRAHYGKMSQAAMARELRRSTGLISKLVKEMGLADARAASRPDEPEAPDPEAGGTLAGLRHLKRILWRNILDCDPRNLAQLSKEYRALAKEIDDIERSEGGGENGEPSALDALVGAIGRKLSS